MSNRFAVLSFAAFSTLMISASFLPPASAEMMKGEKTMMVGGAPMYPSKNIVENAVNSKDHTTLVAAVKAAGLVDTLAGPGSFTVFARDQCRLWQTAEGHGSHAGKAREQGGPDQDPYLSRRSRQA